MKRQEINADSQGKSTGNYLNISIIASIRK